jgi:hypothetical protein
MTAITPRLGTAAQLRYGLGKPSISQLARDAAAVGLLAGQRRLSMPQQHMIVIRGLAVGEPLFACATFADDRARDETLARLHPGTREPLLGSEVLITDVLSLPVSRVPSERLLQAANRILDEPVNPINPKASTRQPVTPREAAQGRADTLRNVRAISSAMERYALELEDHVQIAYVGDEREMELVEIRGDEDGVRDVPELAPMAWSNPYSRFEFTESLGLRRSERLGLITGRASADPIQEDPVIETLAMLRQRVQRFNATQQRKEVPLDEGELRSLLQEAANARFDAGAMMHAALPFNVAIHEPTPVHAILVVCPDVPPHERLTSPPIAIVLTLDPVAGQLKDVVDVVFVSAVNASDNDAIARIVNDRFGRDVSRRAENQGLRARYYGGVNSALASLLGYATGDVQLNYQS